MQDAGGVTVLAGIRSAPNNSTTSPGAFCGILVFDDGAFVDCSTLYGSDVAPGTQYAFYRNGHKSSAAWLTSLLTADNSRLVNAW